MITLRLGLMKLLEKKLFNLPSEHVPAVIGEVLKAEYILVWAHHDSDNVRELAIRVGFFLCVIIVDLFDCLSKFFRGSSKIPLLYLGFCTPVS